MAKKSKKVRGYKVFNPDWTCRGFQYEVGKTYKEDVIPELCHAGFHFCKNLVDCFNYYSFNPENKVAVIEALGDIDSDPNENKVCTNKIKIVKELSWKQVLEMVNIGCYNTGHSNVGNNNSGYYNSGSNNSGNYNSGNYNSGNGNSGSNNSGNYNSGSNNSGNNNIGCFNSGYYNSGSNNSGNYNSGNYNSGNGNSGSNNSGNYNSGSNNSGNNNIGCFNFGNGNLGYYNSGNYNSGNNNLGNYNSGSNNIGCFNTISSEKIMMFNKPSDWSFEDFEKSEAYLILLEILCRPTFWIYDVYMTEEEIKKYPRYKIVGGYNKILSIEEQKAENRACWKKLSKSKKDVIKSLPNFDPVIFEEITGIKCKPLKK